MSKVVRVEIANTGLPVRIFRDKSWKTCPNLVMLMDRAMAVAGIRGQVFDRAYNDELRIYECARCGRTITPETGEMNEIRPKGKNGGQTGGEVSLDNCEALCHQCHQGHEDSAHGNRKWHTSKIKSEEGQS